MQEDVLVKKKKKKKLKKMINKSLKNISLELEKKIMSNMFPRK